MSSRRRSGRGALMRYSYSAISRSSARFVAVVRDALANRIERGEPMPVMHMRSRAPASPRHREEERGR